MRYYKFTSEDITVYYAHDEQKGIVTRVSPYHIYWSKTNLVLGNNEITKEEFEKALHEVYQIFLEKTNIKS